MGVFISVVIPNMNGERMLLDCLASIFEEHCPELEVIVVDNASTDSSVASVRKKFPPVKILKLEKNRGFSSAVNAGISLAAGEYLFILNNDTVAEPGSIARVAEYIEESKEGRVGSYQLAMLDFTDRKRVDALGITLDKTLTGRQIGKGALFRDPDNSKDIWGGCAGACVYKREMLEDIKVAGEYFDEDFFAFYEDVDLSARARLKGWECRLVPKVRVYHIGGGTSVGSFRKNFLIARNRVFFMLKTLPVQVLAQWITPGRLFNLPLIKHYILSREYMGVAACLCGWAAVLPLFAKMMKKRRAIISERGVPCIQVSGWFF